MEPSNSAFRDFTMDCLVEVIELVKFYHSGVNSTKMMDDSFLGLQ